MCIVSWDPHSLSIGVLCVVSEFDIFLWFFTILKGVSTTLLVNVLQLSGVYFYSSDYIHCLNITFNTLIHFVTLQLFIPSCCQYVEDQFMV